MAIDPVQRPASQQDAGRSGLQPAARGDGRLFREIDLDVHQSAKIIRRTGEAGRKGQSLLGLRQTETTTGNAQWATLPSASRPRRPATCTSPTRRCTARSWRIARSARSSATTPPGCWNTISATTTRRRARSCSWRTSRRPFPTCRSAPRCWCCRGTIRCGSPRRSPC